MDVLGYWIDLEDAGFCAFERAALDDIHERVAACCARLTAAGYPISIAALLARNPHYAGLQYLIHEIQDRGYAPEREDAFALMMRGWQQVRLSRFTMVVTAGESLEAVRGELQRVAVVPFDGLADLLHQVRSFLKEE